MPASGQTTSTQAKEAAETKAGSPVGRAWLRWPEVRIPVQQSLPPARKVAYFGGLATLVGFSLIEWPVALAIGVGMLISPSTPRTGR
jgi:hypothetical protein